MYVTSEVNQETINAFLGEGELRPGRSGVTLTAVLAVFPAGYPDHTKTITNSNKFGIKEVSEITYIFMKEGSYVFLKVQVGEKSTAAHCETKELEGRNILIFYLKKLPESAVLG